MIEMFDKKKGEEGLYDVWGWLQTKDAYAGCEKRWVWKEESGWM